MNRRIPFAVIFAVALAIAALLPLYIERTMTRVMFADGSGGKVEWGWRRCTLRGYRDAYQHMDRDQEPAKWLTMNVALAFAYASLIAIPLTLATRSKS
jgi:hypothetical protein